jgi:hypothetical protein
MKLILSVAVTECFHRQISTPAFREQMPEWTSVVLRGFKIFPRLSPSEC